MRDLDEYEAMRNLNPSTDKLGRDRDFQENTAHSIKFLSDKLDEVDHRLHVIEAIIRSQNDK